MNILTTQQSKELDKISIEDFNINSIDLMENAGKSIAQKSIQLLLKIKKPSIIVISGFGNNGGDAFVSARMLYDKGYNVKILTFTKIKNRKYPSLKFYNQCLKRKIPILYNDEINGVMYPDLIIDGIFGTGYRKKKNSYIFSLINWINNSSSIILSIDVPSGLNTDSGLVDNICVEANHTIALEALKTGMVFREGRKYSGSVEIAKIGFPERAYKKIKGLSWKIFDKNKELALLKKPKIDINKYNSGKVLIIAGSKGMTGASILATLGSLRTGAGMTISIIPSSLNNIYESSIIEGITYPLNDNMSGYLKIEHYQAIMEKIGWADCVILGPGLGREQSTMKLIKKLIFSINKPLVLDADGLYQFQNNYAELNKRKSPMIITPHFGELKNLLGIEKHELKNDFSNIMTNFMKSFHHTALVKQIPSCTFHKDNVTINISGNPGLATAGTGDVLSGMIASFISQNMPINKAAEISAFLHGKSADILSNQKGYRGQLASDLLTVIPGLIMRYEQS